MAFWKRLTHLQWWLPLTGSTTFPMFPPLWIAQTTLVLASVLVLLLHIRTPSDLAKVAGVRLWRQQLLGVFDRQFCSDINSVVSRRVRGAIAAGRAMNDQMAFGAADAGTLFASWCVKQSIIGLPNVSVPPHVHFLSCHVLPSTPRGGRL